jgi:hypothetical protein
VVVYGSAEIDDGVSVQEVRSAVFRAGGETVSVDQDAVVAGAAPEEEGGELRPEIPDGTVIPNGTIVIDEESLQYALAGNPSRRPSSPVRTAEQS